MDGESRICVTGQGSVEAIFNGIDKFFNRLFVWVFLTIDAVTDESIPRIGFWSLLKTEIQKPSLMQQGLIFDVLKASAVVYINANTFVQRMR